MIDVVENGVDELADVVVGERVVDVFAIASGRDDSTIAKGSQTLGHSRLVGAGGAHQLGDANLALGDQLDEGEACWVGDGLEEFGGSTDGVGVTPGRTDAVVIVICGALSNHDLNISSNDEVCKQSDEVAGAGRLQLVGRVRRP